MSSSRRLKTPAPRSRASLQTTYRADFKPFNERLIQQLNTGPPSKPTRPPLVPPPKPTRPPLVPPPKPTQPPLVPPRKIDSDTLPRYRTFCYKTTNSTYGSSSFALKGRSLVVTLLEGDSELHGCGGAKQNVLPVLEPSSLGTGAAPPSPPLEVRTPMSSDVQQASSSSSSSSLTSPSSVSPPSPHLPRSLAPPAGALRPGCTRPGAALREAWTQEVAVVKETAAVAEDALVAASRLLHIGSGEGSAAERRPQREEVGGQKVGGQRAETREDVLWEACHSAKLERLLKQRRVSQATITHRGDQLENSATYRENFTPAHNNIKLRESCFPRPGDKHKQFTCRGPWVTEYADKFGVPVCAFPRRVPRGTTLPQASAQPSIHYLVPSGKALCSEYQAYYSGTMSRRPKTSPVYREHRRR